MSEENAIQDELTKLKADYDIAVAAIDELKAAVEVRDATITEQARRIEGLTGDKNVLVAANEAIKKGFESQQRLHTEAVARIASLKKRELCPPKVPDDVRGAGVIE